MKKLQKEIEEIEQGEAWDESDTVVELKAKKPLDKIIPVRIQEDHWHLLRNEAKQLGVGPTTLARMWILEKLRSSSGSYKEIISNIEDRIFEEQIVPNLSKIELNVLNRVQDGLMTQQISDELKISINEVKKHFNSILTKMKDSSLTHTSPLLRERK